MDTFDLKKMQKMESGLVRCRYENAVPVQTLSLTQNFKGLLSSFALVTYGKDA